MRRKTLFTLVMPILLGVILVIVGDFSGVRASNASYLPAEPQSVVSEFVNIPVKADAYVYEHPFAVNDNYGNSAIFVLGADSDDNNFDPLLDFDIANHIPSGVTILSAELRIINTHTDGAFWGFPFSIHPISQPWNEFTVTWNNRPSYRQDIAVNHVLDEENQVMVFDVREIVQKWVNGEVNEYGFYLTANVIQNTESFQAYNPPVSYGPVLSVTYEDPGFHPNPDGYQFCNGPTTRPCEPGWGYYPNEPARSDFTAEDMSDMFGALTVCTSVIGPCILKPSALLWYGIVHEKMREGHCLGMAVTSQRRYEDLDLRHTTYSLTLPEARRAIAYEFVKQFALPIGPYKLLQGRTSTPAGTLQDLRDALSGDEYPTLVLESRDGQTGHAVTPYAIEEIGGGVWHVQVYDNNYPGNTALYIVINTIDNTWSYSGFEGDGNSHSLYILPLYLFDLPQIPLFSRPLYPLGAQADEQPSAYLWLQGGGRLLISDSEGRRLGYLGTTLVNEIPGAGYSPILGGLSVDSEPLYTLPLTETYTVLLDGQTMAQTTQADLVQFGPGYAAAVQDATVSPATRDFVSIAGDGTEISFEASGANEVDLVLALDEEAVSHQFKIGGADVDAGDTSTLSADLQAGVVTFDGSLNGAGNYDLFLTRANASGQHDFFYRGLDIAAGDTHLIQYQAWDGTGSVEVQIDHGSDGTVDETVELENQPQGTLFLPVIRQR